MPDISEVLVELLAKNNTHIELSKFLAPESAFSVAMDAYRNKIEEDMYTKFAAYVNSLSTCDYRGLMDWSTGEIPCSKEEAGGECVCSDLNTALTDLRRSFKTSKYHYCNTCAAHRRPAIKCYKCEDILVPTDTVPLSEPYLGILFYLLKKAGWLVARLPTDYDRVDLVVFPVRDTAMRDEEILSALQQEFNTKVTVLHAVSDYPDYFSYNFTIYPNTLPIRLVLL